MIKLLTKHHSQAVQFLCDKLRLDGILFDLLVTQSDKSARNYISSAVQSDDIVMVGNVGDYSALFADTFGLTMFYDNYAEKAIADYCNFVNIPIPAQHVLDKICTIPETFIHYGPVFGYQCGCHGEYNKKHVYILPDDKRECQVIYAEYIAKMLLRDQVGKTKYVFKVFGFSEESMAKTLSSLPKTAQYSAITDNLDSRITLLFPAKTSQKVIKDVLDQFTRLFGDSIYANADKSLAEMVVELLSQVNITISTAESITGGMIASSIVDVPGSSAVLYEGAVTYSSVAKSKRLGISPHVIDEYGAVSPQVAKAMAEGLKANGTDIVVATTGFAGPDPTGKTPVGLAYIAVGNRLGVKVHKTMYAGDRNTIRALVTNTALYLVIKTIK